MPESIFIRIKRVVSASIEDCVDRMERAGGAAIMRESIREVESVVDDAKTERDSIPLSDMMRMLAKSKPTRVPGTAIFLTAGLDVAPSALMHNLKHNRVMHERNILLSIRTVETPRVARHERITIERVSDHFIRIVARYGFMETPSVPKILEHARRKDCNIDIGATSFFLSRRSLRKTPKSELPRWQERLFILLAASAEDATTYFQIPTDRVVEVGTQVAI